MMSRFFGRHLYSQIVMPLMVASLIVGLVATVIAVYFLSDLTEEWITQVADGVTSGLDSRFQASAETLRGEAALIAGDIRLQQALISGEGQEARGLLAQMATALDIDHVMLLDEEGVVVASAGYAGVSLGDEPVSESGYLDPTTEQGYTTFMALQDQTTLTAVQPVTLESASYTLVASQLVADTLLQGISEGMGQAFAVYDEDGQRVALASADDEISGSLPEALADSFSEVPGALDEASEGECGAGTLDVDGITYRIHAHELTLDDDPTGGYVYVVAVVSQQVTDEARSTTTNLIAMWSIIAVLALVALGGWVARRVSDPLVDLTDGARRIADGDFTTKIETSGSNEIAELANTFNQMTDSLQERSESLTKKVLELATLYEMSRALGSTLEMDVLLESVLDSAMRIFNVDLGYATLRDPESGKLEIRAWRGEHSQADAEGLRNSMSEWVVREGRPLIFNPTRGATDECVDAVTGALAALCVPLVSNEGTVGSITVGSHDPAFRFNSDDVRLLSTIANHVTIAIGNIELFSNLQEAYLSTVRSLAAAVDAKDPFTRGHSDRVAQYAVVIGQEMGLSHEQRIALEMAAYLHDIGKIGIKEEILLKPGRLTDAEMAQMRHHPLIGANILKPVGFPWPITPVVRHHHERWDGGGYPAGLHGDETPLLARILSVADSFEAMIADRPYRIGLTTTEAIAELERCSGTQFDPKIIDVFMKAMEDEFSRMESFGTGTAEEPHPEEAQAIFVALCDGMFSSFRKLGGPRLASNIEDELNAFFVQEGLPFRVANGRMSVIGQGDTGEPAEIDEMRLALKRVDATMSRTSGNTLVDHFYADAMAGLSERMRSIAELLDFCHA